MAHVLTHEDLRRRYWLSKTERPLLIFSTVYPPTSVDIYGDITHYIPRKVWAGFQRRQSVRRRRERRIK